MSLRTAQPWENSRRQVHPVYVVAVVLPLVWGCAMRAPRGAADGATTFQLPPPETFTLSNGLNVWLLRAEQVPLVTVALVVRAGSVEDPPGKEGLAALTASMLDEGAGPRDALEIADEIDFLGAQLSVSTRKEYTQITLQTLSRNLDPALEILADVAQRPAFNEEDWRRVKGLWLNDLAQRREEPQRVVRVVADRAFYGEGHPYAHPDEGYQRSIESIQLSDAKRFHEEFLRPDNCALLVVGDFTADALRATLEPRFGGWTSAPGAARSTPRVIPPSPGSKLRLIVVDKPEAPQTVVWIYVAVPAFGAEDFAPLTLANLIFGGTFTSRLMTNLREKNRLTYGARSVLAHRRAPAHLVAFASVNAVKTLTALVEFCREFGAMEQGSVGPEEVEKARLTHRRRLIQSLETQTGILNSYVEAAALGMQPEKLQTFHQTVLGASRADVETAARENFAWERATVVAVGDRKLIEEQLEKSRREPKETPPVEGDQKLDVPPGCLELPAPEIRGREGEALP